MRLVAGTLDHKAPYRGVLFCGSEVVWRCDHEHRSRAEAWNCATRHAPAEAEQGTLL